MIDRFVELLENEVKNHSIYVWGGNGESYPTVNEDWIGGVSFKTLLGLGGKNGNFGNYTDVWCAISHYWFRHLVN